MHISQSSRKRFAALLCGLALLSLQGCGGGDVNEPADGQLTANDVSPAETNVEEETRKTILGLSTAVVPAKPGTPVFHTITSRAMLTTLQSKYAKLSGFRDRIALSYSKGAQCMVYQEIPIEGGINVSQVAWYLSNVTGGRLSESLLPSEVVDILDAGGAGWSARQLRAWKQTLDLSDGWIAALADGSGVAIWWTDVEPCANYASNAAAMATTAMGGSGFRWPDISAFEDDNVVIGLVRSTLDFEEMAGNLARMRGASAAQVRAARNAARANRTGAAAAAALHSAAVAQQAVGDARVGSFITLIATSAGAVVNRFAELNATTDAEKHRARLVAAVVASVTSFAGTTFMDWWNGRPVYSKEVIGSNMTLAITTGVANFMTSASIVNAEAALAYLREGRLAALALLRRAAELAPITHTRLGATARQAAIAFFNQAAWDVEAQVYAGDPLMAIEMVNRGRLLQRDFERMRSRVPH